MPSPTDMLTDSLEKVAAANHSASTKQLEKSHSKRPYISSKAYFSSKKAEVKKNPWGKGGIGFFFSCLQIPIFAVLQIPDSIQRSRCIAFQMRN